MTRKASLSALTVVLAVAATALAADGETGHRSSVGMPVRIDQIVLPGAELEARVIENRTTPVVVRIVATYPHGTAFRYDLEYYALEPGRYDLRDYLKRKDGTSTSDLPPLVIEVESLLAAGQVLPHDLSAGPTLWLGGYQIVIATIAVAWIAGLCTILWLGRRRRLSSEHAVKRTVSLAERLRQLIDKAMHGNLARQDQAEIERLLLTYWRKRLNWDDLEPAAAITRLRDHEEAGVLLRQLEAWLHKPGGTGEVDIAAILQPYHDLPVEQSSGGDAPVMEGTAARAGRSP
jgi:hypothetical protein